MTKTKPDRKALKEGVIQTVRESVDKFTNLFVISFENLRSTKFKELRREWADDSRFLLGKNTVMQIALGADEGSEYRDNLSLVAQCIEGSIGLLFTNKSVEEVLAFFESYGELDYARGGAVVDETVVMTPTEFAEFNMTYTMLEPLKKLGLTVELQHGVLALTEPYTVCSAGDVLTPEQARLLKLFWKPLATFKIKVECSWSDGKFTKY